MADDVVQDRLIYPDLPAGDRYQTFTVDTPQGPLAVGEWAPQGEVADTPTVLAVHGVTGNHRAWPYLAAALPQVRILAPDLRGRGGSSGVGEPYGMRAHAQDMERVLDARDVQQAIIVGHSMGAFVALVTAEHSASRISQVILVDGGIPLIAPANALRTPAGPGSEPSGGPDIDTVIDHITAPIVARLQTQFASMDEALAYWQHHPAFHADWTAVLADYARYDLAGSQPPLQSRVSLAAMKADSKDLMVSPDLLTALRNLKHPTRWITVERGLQNETPGLYSQELIHAWRGQLPQVQHHHAEDLNHYTIVMSERGAGVVANLVRAAIG